MTTTVLCPACQTSFPVDPAKIPEGGVRAQCSVCPEIFDVEPPDQRPPVSSSERAAPTVEASVPQPRAASSIRPDAGMADVGVSPEVDSPFGEDAEIVTDIASVTSDEFGEREITFESMETVGDAVGEVDEGPEFDGGLELDAGFQVEPVVEPQRDEPPELDQEPSAGGPVSGGPDVSGNELAVDDGAAAPIQFGKRSPEDKARSLARSLVSDLIAYNPQKHRDALSSGTLAQDFKEDIQKSWKEYQDQVDPHVIEQGTFFNDALNELLADGANVFEVEG